MPDEVNLDKLERHEELLSKKEARLQQAHERRMQLEPANQRSGASGPGGGGKSGGGAGVFSYIADHKMILLAGGGAVVLGFILYQYISSQSSSAATGAANVAPTNTTGFVPSDISSQLAAINDQLSSLGSQLTNTTGTSGAGSGGTNNGSGGTNTGGALPGGGSGNPPTNNPAQGSVAPLYGAGNWFVPQANNQWYMVNSQGQSTLLNTMPQFKGATFIAGSGGRLWYQMPGMNPQLVTSGGYISSPGFNVPGINQKTNH